MRTRTWALAVASSVAWGVAWWIVPDWVAAAVKIGAVALLLAIGAGAVAAMAIDPLRPQK